MLVSCFVSVCWGRGGGVLGASSTDDISLHAYHGTCIAVRLSSSHSSKTVNQRTRVCLSNADV